MRACSLSRSRYISCVQGVQLILRYAYSKVAVLWKQEGQMLRTVLSYSGCACERHAYTWVDLTHIRIHVSCSGSSAEPGNGRILALEAPKASQRNAPAPSSAPRRPFQRAASRPPMQICIATTEFAAPAPSTAQRRFLSVRRTPRIPLLTDLATAHKHSLLQVQPISTALCSHVCAVHLCFLLDMYE